jgi:hypothetical protein
MDNAFLGGKGASTSTEELFPHCLSTRLAASHLREFDGLGHHRRFVGTLEAFLVASYAILQSQGCLLVSLDFRK